MTSRYFIIFLLCITIFGLALRFWNYSERFGLAYDQAHDALVAREAIRQGKIPLVGPFSSAGPFQTSGTWYWLLMLPTAIYPQNVLSPWIFLTGICGLLVIGMGILGKKIEDDFFGIILAILTAISTAHIAQSVNLTNQTPQPIFAFLTIACAIWYMKKKYIVSAFGMGFFAGFGASIHLQGMSLAIPVLVAFVLGGRTTIKHFLSAVLGAFLPMFPIFLWDISNDFVNIKNMVYYYRVDQFKISLDVLGRRWLTYLTEFWPREWAHIIGGFPPIAVLIVVLSVLIFSYCILQKKVKKIWLFIFLSFGFMTILIRYTRVPIFASFITFTHPFVILISGWVIYRIFMAKRIVGIVLLSIILGCTMVKTTKEVFTPVVNESAKTAKRTRNLLTALYPGEKFALYDWIYDEAHKSVPEALYLDERNLLSDNGRKIGYTRRIDFITESMPAISSVSGIILDLSSTTSAYLTQNKWITISPSYIYHETEEWRE